MVKKDCHAAFGQATKPVILSTIYRHVERKRNISLRIRFFVATAPQNDLKRVILSALYCHPDLFLSS